jgi:hypothetical protein
LSLFEASYGLIRRASGDDDARRVFASMRLQVAVCVVDANHLLRDVTRRMRTGRMTDTLEAALVGSTRLVTSPEVCAEVVEHLGKFATRYGFDLGDALAVWRREYLPRLHVVDPSTLAPLSDAVRELAQRDPDDVPTGQLIELLQPDTVFSRDAKHLAAFGITAQDSLRIVLAYHAVARRDEVVVVLHGGAMIAIPLSAEACGADIRAVSSAVNRMDKRVLVGAVALIALVGAFAYVRPGSRRWVAEHARGALGLALRGLEAYSAVEANAQSARQQLAAVRRAATTVPRTARDYAVLVLARAPGPLTVRAITRAMCDAGYQPRSAHPEQHVSRVVRRHTDWFEQRGSRRWTLRRRAA